MHIPIDSEIRNDPRFRALAKLVGTEAEALLLCFDAWSLARRYWVDERKYIPPDMWDVGGFVHMETVKLAERRDGGVYCRGTTDSFDWYHDWKAQCSKAGKASATKRREIYGTAQPLGKSPERVREPVRDTGSIAVHTKPIASEDTITVTPTVTLKKTKRAKALSPPTDPEDLAIAADWVGHAHRHMPHLNIDLPKWADSVRLMREQDGLTHEDIRRIFAWVVADDFWAKNAISPQAIRGRSKNGLKKIDNIRLRMSETGAGETDAEWIARKEREMAEGLI